LEQISAAMRNWYGPPIALANVPGAVFAGPGGDFIGDIRGGGFAGLADMASDYSKRFFRRQRLCMGAGFSSFSDLIAASTAAGRRRDFVYAKGAMSATFNQPATLFYAGGQPSAGSIAAGAPTGDALDDSTAGAFPFANPTGGRTQHLVNGGFGTNNTNQMVLLYDRLFSVAKTMASTATEAVTGVPTRYQSTTPADPDYAGGNFLFPEIVTVLPATAHNHDVVQYTAADGTAAQSCPNTAGVASGAANRIDLVYPNWFMPLAAGDVGLTDITQLQHSASLASGSIAWTIGHPIAFIPGVSANVWVPMDFINSALNLQRIFDDACLAFMVPFMANSSISATGWFQTLEN